MKVFGQSMKKKKTASNYQRQFGGGASSWNKPSVQASSDENDNHNRSNKQQQQAERRRRHQTATQKVEAAFGIHPLIHDSDSMSKLQRRGWLYNIQATTVPASEGSMGERSGVDLYFLSESGRDNFKATLVHRPYFYVMPRISHTNHSMSNTYDKDDHSTQLEWLKAALLRRFEGTLASCQTVYKKDLDQPNHLAPQHRHGRPCLQLLFDTVQQLTAVRDELQVLLQKNRNPSETSWADNSIQATMNNPWTLLEDLREYDVPYVVRVCTDRSIRAGTWYTVSTDNDDDIILSEADKETRADPAVLAFDIECTKAPLKFPSADAGDEIFMISYMVSGDSGMPPHGYLIVSRTVVSQDLEDFEYTPQPRYPGPFTLFNMQNERELIECFFREYRRHAPQIVVTYNGDFFDWPFLQKRAAVYGLDLYAEIGVGLHSTDECYKSAVSVHLDAFHWVQRDSYLPQGAQGLKAVTRYKLGYDPVEVDPEDMVPLAQTHPVHMATYSVSDAVATFYLYEKYVHLFIFSLCTIIPMPPEDVLRKGSGTLCETLLVTQACSKDIICPNKQVEPTARFHTTAQQTQHLLESETYIGGKVECLETGVYRSDLEYDFQLVPSALQELIDNVDRDLTFAITVEAGKQVEDCVNYQEVRSEIVQALELLRDRPKRKEQPYIYHLDVGAMYPNIILSNRLQPSAIVDDATCAACDFNQSKNKCKRKMPWIWRGDYSPATRAEYDRTVDQLSREGRDAGLSEHERAKLVAARLKSYAHKAYRKTKITQEIVKNDVVCMRENDFYVDTVRQFRDRRYEYKALKKTWGKKADKALDPATKKQCQDKLLVYDSLQVAHKCILNSFYGYVMRKGARWRSMEMAGIVTKNGADIITQARRLVEQIGRPLELDTDGIWCILPGTFPDVYTFKTKDGSKLKLEYPCVMLNAACQDKFTNHQYQELVDPERGRYETRSECSIFFEVDGPYRCMVLPASTEEGKLLKKRYAVFNHDGSLAELKGFELKRRGELELIKTFQSQVFERFLDGSTLSECYDSVADIANHWIDIIETRGESLDDDELIDLISENRSMSRQLEDYGDQKGTSQTTARRLGEFLGAEIIKDKGLNCKFIISEQPYGAPVTERAVPTAIWKAESNVTRTFLRRWLKSPGLDDDGLDIRNVLDWDYYLDRLGKTIQKIITIPAALQHVDNPVPRVEHPAWLTSKINQMNDKFQQTSIKGMLVKRPSKAKAPNPVADMEDIGRRSSVSKPPIVHKRVRGPRNLAIETEMEVDTVEVQSTDPEKRVVLSKENFGVWLKQKTSLWKKDRKARRAQTLVDGNSGKRTKTAASMEGFVRDAARSLANREWHILEIREMSTYDSLTPTSPAGSGDFVIWAMVGTDSLQKTIVTVPRTVFVSSRVELELPSTKDILEFRRVERRLPHGKRAQFLYEISMPEHVYQKGKWVESLVPTDGTVERSFAIESLYESSTPGILRVLSKLGNAVRLDSSVEGKRKKTYQLQDLRRVEKLTEGEYMNSTLSYRRAFLYVRINPKLNTGIVVLFTVMGGSGSFSDGTASITGPSESGSKSFNISASCSIWVVKPGNAREVQRGITLRDCQNMFQQLVGSIHESGELDSDYSCISPDSLVEVSQLNFVRTDSLALAGANEAISSLKGPTVVLVNSSKDSTHLRRYMTSFNSFPVSHMPFPPGPAHNPHVSTLPPLNWEAPAVQLALEAYLFLSIVSFPKRVSYARYGQVPLGNLGVDENIALFDIGMARLVDKNRSLLWASPAQNKPDLGKNFLPSFDGGTFPLMETGASLCNQDDVWQDEDELVSPVIRCPGVYRTICVDIDVQDLAIAALSDMSVAVASIVPGLSASDGPLLAPNPPSPTSVMMLGGAMDLTKTAGPLGDEMSTTVSLSIVRSMVGGWLKDAINAGSLVADELLHHVYRLISDPSTMLHDPALHRIAHALMKSTFMRVLSELRRLGCVIVFASFNRITVSTNKIDLCDAEEYVNFVISTAKDKSGSALSKVSLHPKQFHTHYVFLDEFNFGTMHLERQPLSENPSGSQGLMFPEPNAVRTVIVPSVVTGWSLTNYLGSELAQEYFKAIIARFSQDVLQKQMALHGKGQLSMPPFSMDDKESNELVVFQKALIERHFAAYLTRAVDEIRQDDQIMRPPLTIANHSEIDPALEFVKNLTTVLALDTAVEPEVHALKRSLLAQVDVPEYSSTAQWVHPCPQLILPDVFCAECQDTRDVNLCYLPPRDDNTEDWNTNWVCDECGTPYDRVGLEERLVQRVHQKVVRYQLQDVRHKKTQRVHTRALECDACQLDVSAHETNQELELYRNLAQLHALEWLEEVTSGLLSGFNPTA